MRVILFMIAILTICGQARAAVILFEDFEDATVSYVTSDPDELGNISLGDYFGRIAPDTATPPGDISFGNLQGNGYYGAQDTDAAGAGNVDLITLDWTGIDISNHNNLELSWFVAEDNATNGAEDWDIASSLRITAQIDGGGFANVFAIESENVGGDQTNERPLVDTDFDGAGDGTEITDQFTQFMQSLPDGNTLDIRVEIEDLDADDEDVAFDSLLLEGDVIPEPSTFALLGFGSIMIHCLSGKRKNQAVA